MKVNYRARMEEVIDFAYRISSSLSFVLSSFLPFVRAFQIAIPVVPTSRSCGLIFAVPDNFTPSTWFSSSALFLIFLNKWGRLVLREFPMMLQSSVAVPPIESRQRMIIFRGFAYSLTGVT